MSIILKRIRKKKSSTTLEMGTDMTQAHIEHFIRDTSLESFDDIQDKISKRQMEYMELLYEIGYPSSDYEVTVQGGYDDPNYFRPRRYELMKYGFIIENGKRPCKITNKTVCVWWFTNDGLKLLNEGVPC